jgi:hypothetical protein
MSRLLDSGAEPDAPVQTGNARRQRRRVGHCTALLVAAGDGQLEAVRLLLDRGADPSLADSNGATPLMTAAGMGHAAVIRELAARGAHLDATALVSGAVGESDIKC